MRGLLGDKARNQAEELKGKVKEAVGKATEDEELAAEGTAERVKGNVKQAAEKVKDAFRGSKHKGKAR